MKWAVIILATILYMIWPYYTLLQLGHAVQNVDPMTINSLVDWKQLRTNLKAQLAENSQSNSKAASALDSQALGDPLAVTFTNAFVARMVTPDGVIRLMQSSAPFSRVAAFFVSPTRFRLDLTKAPPQARTVTVFLEFKGTGWQLSDVRLPRVAGALGS